MTTTPGPWEVNGRAIEQSERTGNKSGWYVIAYLEDEHTPEWEANARLIAAAPEMQSLIAALADSDYARLHHGDLSHAARALLARTEGKE